MTTPSVPPPTDARPAVTPMEIAIISTVGVLVLLFGILLINRLSPSDSPGTASAPSATPPAATEPAASDDSSESAAPESASSEDTPTPEPSEVFQSPTGNIVCAIDASGASCLIRSFDYDPEDADMCGDDAGGHLRVTAEGASMPCDPLAISGTPDTLDYGDSVEANGFTCASAEDGIRCSNSAGDGFQLARAAYRFF